MKFIKTTDPTSPPPEGGYGWIVVIGAFFVHFFVLGNIYSFGVVYPVYIHAFHSSGGQVAWIGSIAAGGLTGLAGVSGSMADKIGNGMCISLGGIIVGVGLLLASISSELWHLYLTQGVICGCGYSLSFIGAVSAIGQYFDKKRGLAVGIAVSGSGLGQFGFAPVINLLLQSFSWRVALQYMAFITTIGLVCCGVITRRRLPLCSSASNSTQSLQYFRQPNFTVLYLSLLLASLGYMMPFVHVVKYAQLHGVGSTQSVYLLSILGLTSALGRAGIGYVADQYSKLWCFRVCVLVGGLAVLYWASCADFISLSVFCILYGFFSGGLVSLLPVVCSELFSSNNMASVMGLMYTSNTIGNLFSAPIGGIVYDATGNYTVSILLAGIFLISGSLLTLLISVQSKKDTVLVSTIETGGSDTGGAIHEFELNDVHVTTANPIVSDALSASSCNGQKGYECVETCE